eukprot:171874_1
MACIILISVGFISYSIIGSILYSKTLIYHQCSNVLISWVVLKFAMYIFVVPIVVYFSTGLFSTVFDDASGFIESCFLVYVTAALFVAMVGLFFSTDIAGLMVRTKNDCDLTIDGGSQFVMFGVNTFLLYGCSIHIGFVVVLFCALCVLLWRASPYNWVEEYEGCILMGVGCSVLCFVLLLLSWGVIGCLLYSEMSQSNISAKQCADATISWSVHRFAECIFLPCVVGAWAWVFSWATYDDS